MPTHAIATALIAEDEPLLAQALAADLARLWPGLQVLATVGDGLSASAQALALRPQVCFLDIRMPGATGLEAAQARPCHCDGMLPAVANGGPGAAAGGRPVRRTTCL